MSSKVNVKVNVFVFNSVAENIVLRLTWDCISTTQIDLVSYKFQMLNKKAMVTPVPTSYNVQRAHTHIKFM